MCPYEYCFSDLFSFPHAEATSALDLASEAALYQLLQEHDIAYVSVGHRPSLMRYHDCALVLRSQDDRVHSSKEYENSDGSDPQDEDHRHEGTLFLYSR